MMASDQNIVVDNHFYQVSGKKDDISQKSISKSFMGIIFTDFEACLKLVRQYGEFFTKLFVK
jgi:hypothetical protein